MRARIKLLAGTSEAGGADCLAPVISHVRRSGRWNVCCLAGRNADHILRTAGMVPDVQLAGRDCRAACLRVFRQFRPDIVLTGLLGGKSNIDYGLISIAKEHRVPVVSILDSWMHYGDRVADPSSGNRLGFLPDKIAVMDRIALKEMVDEGVPQERCVVTGHPRFDALAAIGRKRRSPRLRAALRRKYGIAVEDTAVVFYAHPVKEFYPGRSLGYDERDVYPVFFKAMEELGKDVPLKVIFKEHPRGKSAAPGKRAGRGVRFIARGNVDDLLVIADCAVSMCSTMLVHSAALSIPVFSVQPNLAPGADHNVLTRAAGFPVFASSEQLYLSIAKTLKCASGRRFKPPPWCRVDGGVSRRIERLLLDTLQGDDPMAVKMLHPYLIGEKCYLRGLELSDLKGNYFQWFNDQETTRFMKNGSFPNSEARMRAFFDKMTFSDNDLVLAIIDKKTNRHLGNLGLHAIDWFYRKAELGIIMGEKDSRGKGIATEAIRLLLAHAFSRLNLHKVYLRTEEENTAAIRAFERVGFKREGLIRQECFRAGHYTNSVYMGCLAKEFKGR